MLNFVVHDDAEISRNGKSCDLSDIKPGDLIVVTFTAKPGSTIRHVTKVAAVRSSSDP
jgi:hypothetical protein